jgi:hypothetical protein
MVEGYTVRDYHASADQRGLPLKKERQNVADGMRSSSELIFIIRKYKTIYNTKCRDENPKESFRTVC